MNLIPFVVTFKDGPNITQRRIEAESYRQLKLILSNLPKSVKWKV